jgi:hypothetical protein
MKPQLSANSVYGGLEELYFQQQDGKSLDHLRKRIKISLRDDKRIAILEKISKSNKKLATLLEFSTPFSSSTYEQRPPPKRAPHVRLRPMMHNLYHTMGKLWPCDCPLQHKFRLCLLQCPDESPDPDPTSKVYFNLLMSIQEDASIEYCSWLESKICVSLDGYDHKHIQLVSDAINGSDSPSAKPSKVKFVLTQPQRGLAISRPLPLLARQKPAPVVTRIQLEPTPEPTPFNSPEQLTRTLGDLTSSANSLYQSSIPLQPRRSTSPPSPTGCLSTTTSSSLRIESICKEMTKRPHSKSCPQMHFDGDVLWKMRPTQNKLFVEVSRPGRSLAELLRDERPFNLRERRILAVILAHSLLHFCDSPWLSRHWNKKHIEFFH